MPGGGNRSQPRPGTYGITEADVPGLVAGAKRASRMRANPIELTDDELTGLLSRAL